MAALVFHVYSNLGEYLSLNPTPSIFFNSLCYNKNCIKNHRTIDDQDDRQAFSNGFWDELPEDIMEMILQHLNLIDRVRLSAVCKSWRSLVLCKNIRSAPQIPFLVLPQGSNRKNLNFASISDGKIHNINLPKSLQGGFYCGSSKGWLIIAVVSSLKSEIFLLDPISGVHHQLPSLSTIPSFHEIVDHLDNPDNVWSYIYKIELSSIDTSECLVAAIFDDNKILALCKVGGKSWSIFQESEEENYGDFLYHDMVFSDETLFIMKMYNKDEGIAASSTFKSADFQVNLKFIPLDPPIEIPDDPIVEYLDDFFIYKDCSYVARLVRSNDGKLLLVCGISDYFRSKYEYDEDEDEDEDKDDNGEDEDSSIPILPYHKRSRFEIFTVELNIDDDGTSYHMSKIDTLNDQILFLSQSESFILEAKEFDGVRGNCIYFVEGNSYPKGECPDDHYPLVSRESGVFYLDNERIRRFLPSFKLPMMSRMSWFIPYSSEVL